MTEETSMTRIKITADDTAEIDAITRELGWNADNENAPASTIRWMAGICQAWLEGRLPKRGEKHER